MGSYLAQALSRRITASQFVAKSGSWLLRQAQKILPSDEEVEKAEAAAQAAVQAAAKTAEDAFAHYLGVHVPRMDEDTARAIAVQIGNMGVAMVETAISAAGGAVKAHNIDASKPA